MKRVITILFVVLMCGGVGRTQTGPTRVALSEFFKPGIAFPFAVEQNLSCRVVPLQCLEGRRDANPSPSLSQ
jgi:hypothetical protein